MCNLPRYSLLHNSCSESVWLHPLKVHSLKLRIWVCQVFSTSIWYSVMPLIPLIYHFLSTLTKLTIAHQERCLLLLIHAQTWHRFVSIVVCVSKNRQANNMPKAACALYTNAYFNVFERINRCEQKRVNDNKNILTWKEIEDKHYLLYKRQWARPLAFVFCFAIRTYSWYGMVDIQRCDTTEAIETNIKFA